MAFTPVVEWDARDGRPFAHVEIVELDLGLAGLSTLIDDLLKVRSEMVWFSATWLVANSGATERSHLFTKETYMGDPLCKALCGKIPNGKWNEHWQVYPLFGDPGEWKTCKTCRASWQKKQAKEV